MKQKIPEIRIGFPFLASAAFFLSGELRINYIYALVFSLLHEAGHLIAMVFFGCVPDRITVGTAGIRIDKTELSMSAKQECITALSGPFVNLVLMLLFSFDVRGLPFLINAGLLIFNLLPLKTLDGGRFFYNIVLIYTNSVTALKVVRIAELFTAIILVFLLIFLLIAGIANATFILFVFMFVLTAVWELLFAN